MAKIPAFSALENEYARLLRNMQVRPSWDAAIDRRARAILANKARYQAVSEKTGVPWAMIGVIHSMEGGLSFATHLHNGDSLKKRTRHVPAGRPVQGEPPFTWEESACDALLMKGLDKIKEWSPERICYELERYNGFGYRQHHPDVLSPYLWSGTTYYTRGKYVSDGKWSSAAVSGQTGAVPLLKRIAEIEGADVLGGVPPTEPIPLPARKPVLAPKELVAASRKLALLSRVRSFIAFCFTTTAGLITADNLGVAKSWVTDVKEIAWSNALWILLVAGLAVWLIAKYIQDQSVRDHEQGRYTPSGAA